MSIDAIRFKTYNNVIDTIKCVGEQHLQIQKVTTGDIWEIDLEKNTEFPLFHINPVNVSLAARQKTFNFQLFMMDLVEPNESNEQEVLSDMLEIMTDIVGLFKHSELLYTYDTTHGEEPRYFVDDDFTCEPFTERFENRLAGWAVTFTINTKTEMTIC